MNLEIIGAQLDALVTLSLGIVFLALRGQIFKGNNFFKTKTSQRLFIAGGVLMIAYGGTKVVLAALGYLI
jgi:hypothetical protein